MGRCVWVPNICQVISNDPWTQPNCQKCFGNMEASTASFSYVPPTKFPVCGSQIQCILGLLVDDRVQGKAKRCLQANNWG